ncbi:S24 family peptidase [Pedobacter sp. NJ-S-72]
MDIIKKVNDIAVEFFDDNNSKFASKMGTSEANIRNYRSKIVPKIDFIIRLCNEIEINFDWMFNDSGPMKMTKGGALVSAASEFILKSDNSQRVPLYNTEAAVDLVKLFEGHENIIDYISIPNLPKSDGALYIKGDSMYPLLKSGDIVIYKRINNIEDGIFYGEMYLLSINIDGDDTTVVKYIQKSDKGEEYIKLVSQNTHHSSKDINLKHVKAIAWIKASIRINSMQ